MVDSRIIRFFRKHHVLTIATSSGSEPWCANCFYVYLEEENALVFTSDSETRHGREFLMNSLVAGSVVLETMVLGKIQGIQFQGRISEPGDDLLSKIKDSLSDAFSGCSADGYKIMDCEADLY